MDLDDICEAFVESDPADRLELLIDFGKELPPLDEAHRQLRDTGMYIVHECQAPVFFHAVIEDNCLLIAADVPLEAPIARGFTGLLYQGFNNMSVEQLPAAPENMLEALGLSGLVGMQRTRGLSAIYACINHLRTTT